ncbi:two-component regulator propeller domain-containing protein [Massilia sp. 9I]|uniref:two-component regulator propeller domain-containing protein n=1 Tax=Massilia sp. 9I TaxID=2653152 RepID=UPI0012F310CA|nr:two-component regulator propeller domain-containing protein [Massilia sp. 9I]VXB11029.1 Sensor histidin kinase [Massilia sp. 9I]
MFALMRGPRLALVALLLMWIWGGCALAAPRSLRFERLSIEHGLSQQSVLTILQDRRGFMWFGTQAGLNRFDGYRVTVYRNNPDQPESLPDNYVLASYEDGQGRLWFGTKGGLARFDQATGKFVRYLASDDKGAVAMNPPPGKQRGGASNAGGAFSGNRAVLAIQPAQGGLWLATGDGLQFLDTASGAMRSYRHDPNDPATLRDNRVNALALDARGALWIGTAAGIDRLAPGADRFEHYDVDTEDLQRNTVLALSMGPRDTLWVGTASGLEAWRLGDGASYAQPQRRRLGGEEGLGELRINALYHDGGGTLWVGTELGGLKWLDPSTGRFISYRNDPTDPHTLSDNQVSSMLVDRTGTLWAGTQFGGVSRTDLASGGFARYGGNEGLGRAKVRAVAEDGAGRVWIGTTGDGLMRMDRPGGPIERAGQGGEPGEVITALAYARERVWIGTPTGLAWRDASGRFGHTALGGSPGASYVQALHAGRSGTLWIVTRGGLAALAPGQDTVRTWRHDASDPASLGENYGFTALEDRQGIVWIGTETGLERYDPATGRFTHYRHDPANPNGLRHSRIYHLMESTRGDLWVGTAGGLHRMQQGKDGVRFRFYPFSGGPEALPIGATIEDAHGYVWASTTTGITRVEPGSGATKSYTAKDGLVDGSYFVGAAMRGSDGQFYFGGVNGLTSFMPDAVRDNPYAPEVVITDFLVLNRSRAAPNFHEQSALSLSYRDSVFALEFAALHYADPDGNRYAYQLEGFDQGWVDTDARRRYASYTNLDPGTYVFRVRASNKDGVWSTRPATLTITITPPFWKTWWFRTLAVLATLTLFTVGYRLRIRALVAQKVMLEHEVGVRTTELRRQKDSAERRKQEVEEQKEVVEQAHRNIALLSDIGRALTANLELEAIMRALYENVHALMDATLFAVVLRHPERGTLEYAYAVVDGERREAFELPEDADRELAAWAMVRGREVLAGDLPHELPEYLPALPPEGALELALPCAWRAGLSPRSLLLVPVMVGERVLGALTVQSPAARAYGQVHLDMLETLAAYVGVAIDNASAYHQLKETQAQLAAQEKLASLGSLVAGVAHELNTPIGNSLLMASTLQEQTSDIAARFDSATLRRSDLADYVSSSREAAGLIMRSLHNAAELVNSFRQVSVDQASAQRRRFELAQACQEIAATLMNKVRLAGHRLELDVPPGIVLDSFPGPLGQVVINFVNNALLHAFDKPGGSMVLAATLLDGASVRIEFRDDGRGIPLEHQTRIFDPFFTTRMGQGGTGLGLNISWNIVTTLLGGSVRVESSPGQGAAFILELPLHAPDPQAGQGETPAAAEMGK